MHRRITSLLAVLLVVSALPARAELYFNRRVLPLAGFRIPILADIGSSIRGSAFNGGTITGASLFTARTTFGSAQDAANSIDFNNTTGCVDFEGTTANGIKTSLCATDPIAPGLQLSLPAPAVGTTGTVLVTQSHITNALALMTSETGMTIGNGNLTSASAQLRAGVADAANSIAIDWSAGTFIAEGTTANAFETTRGFVDPTADTTINDPALGAGTYITTVGSNSVSITGPTAPRTLAIPDAASTMARTDAAQTFTGTQSFALHILPTAVNTSDLGSATLPVRFAYIGESTSNYMILGYSSGLTGGYVQPASGKHFYVSTQGNGTLFGVSPQGNAEFIFASVNYGGGRGMFGRAGMQIGWCNANADPNGCTLDTIATRTAAGYMGMTTGIATKVLQGTGSAPAVSNTSANSCGTSAASIVGTDMTGAVTVGATSGTSCTLTFNVAATTRRQCFCHNETTLANVCNTHYTDTTHSNLVGTFVAGDVIAYGCMTY